ncbi:PAS domain-containing sensor histidine kinase [Halarcobacter bivalviorum]|uniref:histidine kinase n=1 Tax=Halarcobacter bivalviorum TaxID=663364 RepID=A0AAX2A749_9BACT|nr:PAS domain S-box protein [Halarcobacter bivalviorum]AXH11537.1 PAS sensor-containing two-component system histidine kinase [Halarcobacter bivalviorum]RXK09280.1 PAS domain-containing sensor histidine kinase [Halarcobacter bivalviorum]
MKVQFSLKLFLAFLLFSLIFFVFTSFLTYKTFQTKVEQKNIENFLTKAELFQERLDDIISSNETLMYAISNAPSFKKINNKEILEEEIKILVESNDNIHSLKIIKNSGESILSLEKKDRKVYKTPLELSHLIHFYLNNEEIEKNRLFVTEPYLLKEKEEIKLPIETVVDLIYKVEEKTIFVSYKIDTLLESIKKIDYLIDKDLNIVYDKTGLNSWSKYYNPNLNIQDLIRGFSNRIFSDSFIVTNSHYLKQIFFNKEHFFTLVDDNERLTYKDFFLKYENSFYNVAFLMFIITFIMSMIFTTPLSNINKKLESEKNVLSDSIKRNSLMLNDSLALLDQHVMYIKLDTNFIILDTSSYLSRVTGFEKQELLGQKYSSLLTKNSAKHFEEHIINILNSIGTWNGELQGIKKIAGDYWVKSNIQPDFNEFGELIGYTDIRNDISDNKRIEKLYNELNYQIEQLNTIFQNANSGIALIDFDGNFRRFNEKFFNLFKYTENEIVEKKIFDLVDSGSLDLLKKIIEEVKEYGSILNIELVFICKNQEELYLDVSLNLLPDRKNIVMVANSLEDKRKLQELNHNLESRVAQEVKKNIEKDRIHQEEQIKNAKLTSIGTLAAGITHEINTPLTYLKGNFEMLTMDIEDLEDKTARDNMLESCEKIEEAINRIAVTVESMREISQSSSEARERVNIFATLFTSLTMAYNVSKQISKIYLNNKEFTPTTIDKNDFEIFAKVQKQRIEQVWIIIINNALDELKNMQDYEQRELRVDVYQQEDEVIVKFSDNAGGINEAIIDKIFDPFVSSKTHSGMGVGLNIAKKIINDQEGEILAYNSEIGAVFEVKLKLQE